MDGEPLMRFDLTKKLAPFGKRRAFQYGKRIQFGVTTICMLVTEEVMQCQTILSAYFHKTAITFDLLCGKLPYKVICLFAPFKHSRQKQWLILFNS